MDYMKVQDLLNYFHSLSDECFHLGGKRLRLSSWRKHLVLERLIHYDNSAEILTNLKLGWLKIYRQPQMIVIKIWPIFRYLVRLMSLLIFRFVNWSFILAQTLKREWKYWKDSSRKDWKICYWISNSQDLKINNKNTPKENKNNNTHVARYKL